MYHEQELWFHYNVIVHMVLCLLTYICYFSLNLCEGKSEAKVQLHINILTSIYASLDLILRDLFMQLFVTERNSREL